MQAEYTTRKAERQPRLNRGAISTFCAARRAAETARIHCFEAEPPTALHEPSEGVRLPQLRAIGEATGAPMKVGFTNADGTPQTYELHFEGVRFYAYTNYVS